MNNSQQKDEREAQLLISASLKVIAEELAKTNARLLNINYEDEKTRIFKLIISAIEAQK
jgi:uncharacterized membrane protein YqjE